MAKDMFICWQVMMAMCAVFYIIGAFEAISGWLSPFTIPIFWVFSSTLCFIYIKNRGLTLKDFGLTGYLVAGSAAGVYLFCMFLAWRLNLIVMHG